jgi:hypothetical protein
LVLWISIIAEKPPSLKCSKAEFVKGSETGVHISLVQRATWLLINSVTVPNPLGIQHIITITETDSNFSLLAVTIKTQRNPEIHPQFKTLILPKQQFTKNSMNSSQFSEIQGWIFIIEPVHCNSSANSPQSVTNSHDHSEEFESEKKRNRSWIEPEKKKKKQHRFIFGLSTIKELTRSKNKFSIEFLFESPIQNSGKLTKPLCFDFKTSSKVRTWI